MDVGLFSVMDFHPLLQESPSAYYEEMIQLGILADEAKLESFWVAEHHFSPYGLCPSPAVFLAALARVTKRIRLGPAVCVLPFQHPLKVAEEYAMVDVLSGGRLEMGIGRGYLPHEFAGHGISPEEAGDRFEESLDILIKAWGGQVEGQGSHYPFSPLTLNIRPLQRPYPPLHVAALRSESYARIGRQGHSIIGIPYLLEHLDVLKDLVGTYKAAFAQGKATAVFHVYVGETQAKAEEEAFPYLTRYCQTRAVGNGKNFAQLLERELVAVGDPERIRAFLAKVKGFGLDRVLCLMNFGGMPFDQVRRSLELLVGKVL